MPATRDLPAKLLIALASATLAATAARADVVTGTVSPQGASVVIVDSNGTEVARLPAGAGRQVHRPLPGAEAARAGDPEPVRPGHGEHQLRLSGT